MIKKYDGGPVFPIKIENVGAGGTGTFHAKGLTLRQYIAIEAMKSIIIANGHTGCARRQYEIITEESFLMADTMLAHEAKEKDKK